MHLSAAIAHLEAAVEAQLAVTGPETAEVGAQLMTALEPAIRQALLEAVTMAATEVSSQLASQRVEVRLVDGEPELVVTDDPAFVSSTSSTSEGDETRITLRLPHHLKELIAEAAEMAGDSVNSYVVEALRSQARARKRPATRTRTMIQL
jgi:hypothetical protein